jgi:hypothetical protein
LGRIESRQCAASASTKLKDHEFRVYSQWGEDGILQFLLREVPIAKKVFVEFGVENYTESNTRFLLTKDNWGGLVLDGSDANISYIKQDPIYWKHNLKAVPAFITRDNIDGLLRENGLTGEIGLLSIDIDGNDYWVWEKIESVAAIVVVVEYNSRFGPERRVTVPYDPQFVRQKAHYSGVYYGASLAALVALGNKKGYAFVGSNSAGNNAFFVRRDRKPASLRELTAAEGYVAGQFRESRNERGELALLPFHEETALIANLPVEEVNP